MTLVELLATIGIIGVLSVIAIPSFRGLQARENMTLAQQGVHALLTRMQQLALAPPERAANEKVVGYGLAFHKKAQPDNNLNGCRVMANNDFFALYKFVVSRDPATAGQIIPVLNAFDSSVRCEPDGTIQATDYKKDFFTLPSDIIMNATRSQQLSQPRTAFPWLLSVPLQSAANYQQINPTRYGYNNPLPAVGTPKGVLVIQHAKLRVNNRPLCRKIEFSRSSSGIATTTQIVQGC
jgi:type II secretory pathway pseudopilin PulG